MPRVQLEPQFEQQTAAGFIARSNFRRDSCGNQGAEREIEAPGTPVNRRNSAGTTKAAVFMQDGGVCGIGVSGFRSEIPPGGDDEDDDAGTGQ